MDCATASDVMVLRRDGDNTHTSQRTRCMGTRFWGGESSERERDNVWATRPSETQLGW